LLNISHDEAKKYLSDNSDKFDATDNNDQSSTDALALSFENADNNVKLIKDKEEQEAEAKQKEKYKKMVKHLGVGFEYFYDKIENKDDAITIINAFIVNMHCDMGFTLSVAALPLCRMQRVDKDVKDKVFHEFAEQIKINGTTCSADEEREKSKKE